MSDFINTIEVLGDEATMDAIIERTITEFKDNVLTEIGNYAFNGCTALTTVDLPNVTKLGEFALSSCTSLTEVNLPNLTLFGHSCLSGCTSLESIELPSITKGGSAVFKDCSKLKIVGFWNAVDLGAYATGQQMFMYTNLTALLLRNTDDLSTLDLSYRIFHFTPIASGTGYIYVPRALIEDYKVATNWSTYASQFRALEDYTVDGTTSGELDETKI